MISCTTLFEDSSVSNAVLPPLISGNPVALTKVILVSVLPIAEANIVLKLLLNNCIIKSL